MRGGFCPSIFQPEKNTNITMKNDEKKPLKNQEKYFILETKFTKLDRGLTGD